MKNFWKFARRSSGATRSASAKRTQKVRRRFDALFSALNRVAASTRFMQIHFGGRSLRVPSNTRTVCHEWQKTLKIGVF